VSDQEQDETAKVAALLDGMAILAIRHLTTREISFTAASTLSRLARGGPARLTRLAAEEGVAQPSMTQLVQRLRKQGLVTRVGDPDDGRVVLISITDDGRRHLEVRHQARVARLTHLLSTLSAADREALGEAARGGMPALERLMESALRVERLSGDTPA
jgi:DNA-binding MarR family transcriptional regulator